MKIMYLLFVSLLLITPITAQTTYTLFSDESDVVVKGTSSVHDWESKAEAVKGEASFAFENGTLEGIESLTFSVETESIKSGKKVMDGKTRGALKAKEHPTITFYFTELTELSIDSVSVTGNLTLAGVTKEINLTGTYQIGADGSLMISGAQEINMNDYGIKPPTAMLGTLKTGEMVIVEFNVNFKK